MPSIFTKIINRELPGHIVGEDDNFIAFLDIQPLAKGHTLVVPKKEVDYIFDVSDDLLSEMMVFAKKIALKLDSVIECKRIGVSVVGLEVPHTHIHLIPINSVTDMNFEKEKLSFSEEEMSELKTQIINA